MSKRYYLCDIIGDGTRDNPYRPAVADYRVNWVCEIDENNPTALALVATTDHSVFINDDKIDELYDGESTDIIASLPKGKQDKLKSKLKKRGFDFIGVDNKEKIKDVIKDIGVSLSPNFNVDSLNVSE